MLDSNILDLFEESHHEFKPYGLTCALRTPSLMRTAGRHNEIEINYFPEGTMTYLFQDKRISIPAIRFAIFWGLVSHQIVNFEGEAPYFVCTIPFSLFLGWKLSASFVDRILKGEVLLEASEEFSIYDEFLLKNWVKDITSNDSVESTIMQDGNS